MKTEIHILLVAAVLSVLFCALLIPVLRRAKAGQYILGYVKEHKGKGGTPTMGGLAFLFAALLTAIAFGILSDRQALVALTFGGACAAVGFLDDFLKLRHRRNLGLRSYQKIIFQAVLSVLAGVYCYVNERSSINLPFFGGSVECGVWIIPLVAFAFVATTNCVNLTDGLDGLAASVALWFFAFMAVIVLLTTGQASLARLSIVLCGVLAGYLLFNTYKASVFMGDTGSLGLGGFAAAIASLSGNVLYILPVGIMFVCSGISVIVQVIYYKRTGKRIFRMAPLHHHFQELGMAESKIVFAYALVTVCAGLLCIDFLL